MSALAGSFPQESPGLPRGRGRIDPDDVRAAQRPRILRAAITAFAERGFHATTVADIVTRARVSRAAFYAQFGTKEDCFIAAVDSGRTTLMPKIAEATTRAWPQGFATAIGATVREYLRVCASEPEFTRAWTLEFPHAGPTAVRIRNEYFDTLAATLRAAHLAHVADTDLPHRPLGPPNYLALIGGCHELFYRHVAANRTDRLPDLEPAMTQFLLDALTHTPVPRRRPGPDP
ncbi:MAG: TetR/AcrR family transcriptional regulator [Pseudonocardiaceae bacterium]